MPLSPILGFAIGLGNFLMYPFIAVLAPFGGPLFIMAAGFLLHEHVIALVPTFIAIAIGELSMDSFWYVVGHRYATTFIARHGHFFSITPELFARTQEVFKKQGLLILFFAKLTMGFGMMQLVLASAGSTKMRFSAYVAVCALGEAFWVSALLYLGYAYAGLYGPLHYDLRWILLGATLVILTPLFFGLSRFLQKKALKRI